MNKVILSFAVSLLLALPVCAGHYHTFSAIYTRIVSLWTPISGLYAHWLCNENAANTTVSDSKGSNTGTSMQNTSVMHTNGVVNGAFHFNGSGDYIYGTLTNPIIGNVNFSVTAWFKTTKTGRGSIINGGSMSTGQGWWLAVSNGGNQKLTFDKSGGGGAISSNNVCDGVWHFACGTYDGTNFRVYVDGALQGTSQNTFGSVSGSELRIGDSLTNYSSWYWAGDLDDVRIYTRALSQSDITALYNGGNGTEAE